MDKMTRFVDVMVFNTKNQLLLLKRCENAEFMPSKWCLPGGHVENGSLIENAQRELEEETGIIASQLYLMKGTNWTYESGDACTTVFVTFMDFIGEQIPRITITEHSEYKFFDIDSLPKKDMLPELYDIIKCVLKINDKR